ncbi:unnamed protein product [Fraxinus pennsylvanica]|uniref:Signal peptidase complex subunit 1 n=1 Tax=Fraxinus pennsylvanica TaxID=56036 RepID=A0AAD2E596_9LAMI|nr:unnamed protein product [Fraxinus pennsylvanica]
MPKILENTSYLFVNDLMVGYLLSHNLRLLVPLLHRTILSTAVTSPMDWQGQKLAEHLMQLMLVSFAVVAFIMGYVLGSFQTMLLIYAAGVVLTSLIIIPNWPFFNRHPLNWLDPSEAEKHPKPLAAKSGPKKKTSKKKFSLYGASIFALLLSFFPRFRLIFGII